MGDLVSALNSLGDTASFGLAPAAMRGVQNFLQPGSGDETAAKIAAVNQAHPAGVVAGTLASIPVDMALTAPIAAVAPAIPAVNALVRGGGVAADLGRMAATGSVIGGLNAATHGGDALTGVGEGAVLGPVAGVLAKPIAAAAERLITPAATKAWRYLAGKLGENPDQLVGHITQYVTSTGRQPSLQQIVSDHDAGVIAQFGSNYPQAGQVLRAGAQASETALPTAARDAVDTARAGLPAAPQLIGNVDPATASHADILNARGQNMTNAMAPIRSNPVLITDPDLIDDVQGQLSGRQLRGVKERLSTNTLTLDDADTIRQKLAAKVEKPGDDVDQIRQDFMAEITGQHPAYADLIDQYSHASRYADSFAHGASGAERGAASDAGLRASLASAEGEAGYRAGALSRTSRQAGGSPSAASGVLGDISRPGTAQDAFRSVAGNAATAAEDAAAALRQGQQTARATAPGALRPQPEGSSAATNVGMGLAEAPIAPISAVRNVSRGLLQAVGAAPRINPAMQRSIAQAMVSDNPAIRDHAVQLLRDAGVSDARLKLIQNLAAANAASRATNYGG